jgi:hypothetical protein
VIPVVNPEGFLTSEEFALLDASLAPESLPDELPGEGMALPE